MPREELLISMHQKSDNKNIFLVQSCLLSAQQTALDSGDSVAVMTRCIFAKENLVGTLSHVIHTLRILTSGEFKNKLQKLPCPSDKRAFVKIPRYRLNQFDQLLNQDASSQNTTYSFPQCFTSKLLASNKAKNYYPINIINLKVYKFGCL